MKAQRKEFPLAKTKVRGLTKGFDLAGPKERKKYFQAKVGQEVTLLRNYLKRNTFIAYFLGKKNAGKGTYTKLMMEIFGSDKINHISVGDIVRAVHQEIKNKKRKQELLDYLSSNYRGYISIKEVFESLSGRSTKSLLPTEFILALLKREIDKLPRKSLFIDGFPRDLDQVSYSLFFRDLINYRDDPDIFIAIDIPESVIDARMKNRVVCPKCQTPRSLKLFPTKEIGYDQKKKEFYLICDDPQCRKARMVAKEGDNLGIESIRDRLTLDSQLIDKIFSLHGIPKILLRNSVPVKLAKQYVDDYEITPEYSYQFDSRTGKVKMTEKPWIIKDDQGQEVYSLLAPPVVVSLVRQLVKVLGLEKD